MGMFDGKKGLVLGVANDRSIAWAIAKTIMDEGGEIGFTHLPDRPDDEKQKNRRRVTKCTDQYPDQTKFVVPMNVQDDGDIASVMETAKQEFGEIDFLSHLLIGMICLVIPLRLAVMDSKWRWRSVLIV